MNTKRPTFIDSWISSGGNRRGQNPEYRNRMFRLMCYAYIILGCFSVMAGIAVYLLPFFLNHQHAPHIDVGLGFVIVVLLAFGSWRIATGVWHLRRIRRARGPRPPRESQS